MLATSEKDLVSHTDQVSDTYASSWFDRLSNWVDKLPLPAWLVFLLMSVLLILTGMVVQQIDNSGTILDWNPITFVAIFQIAYIFSVTHYLDKYALRALDDFKPALKLDDKDIPELARLISTLPAGRTLAVSIGFILIAVALIAGSFVSQQGLDSDITFTMTPFGVYSMIVFLLLWLSNGLFVYHTIHQLKAVNYIYINLTVVHPFHQRELYAFSGLSALTGIGIVLITPLWIVFDPGWVSLSISIAFAVFSLIAFLTPLYGVHRILENEKDRLIDENARQVEESISSLMLQLRRGNVEGLERLDQALTSLEKARVQIERISTWPWKTETPRRVIAAIFLPLLIWIIQYFLAQLLSG
jgi:hypothetical protein